VILMPLLLYALTIAAVSSFAENAEDELGNKQAEVVAVFPDGYLTDTVDNAVYISGSRGIFIGSSDEEGGFIALGGKNGGSAFGKLNRNGSVMILYSPVNEER